MNRAVEHRALGTGMLLWIRQLTGGSDVAVVRFGDGAERTIRLDPAYWITAISEILRGPGPVERESATEENDEEETEPELGEEVSAAA